MSIVWPITKEPPGFAAASLVAAVAVRRGVLEVMEGAVEGGAKPQAGGAAAVQIKWPNDLLVYDRKVAGILCEQFLSGALGNVLIVGIGVNVDFDLALLGSASELRHPPTTLAAALGRSVSVDDVMVSVSHRIEEAFQEYERHGLDAALLAELRANLAYRGEVRSFSSPKGIVTGRMIGIDDEGRLLLESEGREIKCDLGEWVTNASSGY
jgi:BirA family biotin operon repressor/biotin-[acetyl-CoA-carboxylase] ligase